jgi:hypothetical protein
MRTTVGLSSLIMMVTLMPAFVRVKSIPMRSNKSSSSPDAENGTNWNSHGYGYGPTF